MTLIATLTHRALSTPGRGRPARRLPALGCLALAAWHPQPARAQVALTLLPAVQAGAPGTLLTFSGTVSNSGASAVFLNGDVLNLTPPGLSGDPTPFLFDFPTSLAHNGSFTGSLFTVAVGPTVGTGDYLGTFSIKGGANANAQSVLASRSFTVRVGAAAVPEPSTLSAFLAGALGLGGLAAIRRRRPRMAQGL